MDNNITVSEAAQRLGRSIEQVRRYLREGKLAGKRIGQQWFIPESALATTQPRSEIQLWLDKVAGHLANQPMLPDLTPLIRQDRDEH